MTQTELKSFGLDRPESGDDVVVPFTLDTLDARGRIVRNIARAEPQSGGDVATTIDVDLQGWLVERLSRERRAAAVAIDVIGGSHIR